MFAANFSIDSESQITLIAAIAIAGAVAWLFLFIMKRIKNHKELEGEILDHKWDGIGERNNPAPKVMHVIMLSTFLFTVWYATMGFPLGSFSQITQYNTEVKEYKETFDQNWSEASEDELSALGESIFNSKCVACHGYTGEGQDGKAANLIEFGSVKHVVYVLKNGSQGMGKLTPSMPAFYMMLGATPEEKEQNAADVAAYVVSLSNRTPSAGNPEAGKTVFDTNCSACHGFDGKGNGIGGSIPNMAANLTEYGTAPYVEAIIRNGKKGLIGEMPGFEAEGTLSNLQYQALSLYVAKGLVE